MSDKPKSRFWRFWTTLPGVLTGVAGVLSASVAAVSLLSGGGGHPAGTTTPPKPQPPALATSSTDTTTPAITDTSTTSVPDQHAWEAQMNSICREAGRSAQAREAAENVKPGSVAKLEIEAESLLSMDRQLRAPDAPRQDEVKLLKMAADWDAYASEDQFEASALKEGEKAHMEEDQKRAEEDNEQGNQIAYALGLDICAAANV